MKSKLAWTLLWVVLVIGGVYIYSPCPLFAQSCVSNIDIEVDDVITFDADTEDGDGGALSGYSVSYSSNNSGVASVSDGGDGTASVTGVSAGTANITTTASKGGESFESVVSVVVSEPEEEPEPSALYPNRPTSGDSWNTVFHADGTTNVWDEVTEYPGWLANVASIDDPENPIGTDKSLQFTVPVGNNSAGLAEYIYFDTAYSEWYISFRIYVEHLDPEGFKWMYLGQKRASGNADQMYITHEGDHSFRFQNQHAGANDPGPYCNVPNFFADDTYVEIEIYMVAESDNANDDGEIYCYKNGVLVDSETNVNWGSATPGFDGLIWWDQSNDTTDIEESWLVREFLIQGRESSI